MSKALYRKYRSRSLAEVVGQEHITELLGRQLAAGTVSHAYLLTGPRGVGKTSIARILAHQLNDLPYDDEADHLDIIEIDAASNNGVEDVRDLRDKVHVAPTSARRKVYIIDEVHMLSKAAFNALLKTLEEPPEHVVFILATTDADKLPATIISRVQRYNLRTISLDAALQHLRHIATQEKIAIDDAALELIAAHGDGSFRDSIGALDQLRHAQPEGTISEADVAAALGLGEKSQLDRLINAYRAADLAELASTIHTLESGGVSASIVARHLIRVLSRELVKYPDDSVTLDKLLLVASSSYPFIKLLTALAPRASIEQSQLIAKTKPPATTPPAPKISAQPAPTATAPANVTSDKPTQPETKPVSKTSDKPVRTKKKPISAQLATADFDWDKLLLAAQASSTALYALLSKSGHRTNEAGVQIFAGNKFNAQRLGSSKRQAELAHICQESGFGEVTFMVEPTKKPPSDSQAADVAAIMGGGEEVEYDG